MVDKFKRKGFVTDYKFKTSANIFIAINVLVFVDVLLNIFIAAFSGPSN